MFDSDSEFDQRVRRRLAEEWIIWLTTIDSQGRPQPRPVWFLWDGAQFIIYSQPDTFKLKHIQANPQVSLHLDGDGQGGDIIIFSGKATIEENPTPANELAAYVAKYPGGFKRVNMTAVQFAQKFPIAIKVTPTKLRGH
ncbi:MAG: TIGR03667 family PPOX class F420-dependent oxidoreductase [Ardenticatenaceae bacterium]|nr:TIGR03667 family PPOX class F420-dependent oxidoreductase [Ardenticatenaceae bacterium]